MRLHEAANLTVWRNEEPSRCRCAKQVSILPPPKREQRYDYEPISGLSPLISSRWFLIKVILSYLHHIQAVQFSIVLWTSCHFSLPSSLHAYHNQCLVSLATRFRVQRCFSHSVYAHLLWERNLLTSNSKFLCWPGSQDKLTAKCNINFGVNIFPSQADGLPCTKLCCA